MWPSTVSQRKPEASLRPFPEVAEGQHRIRRALREISPRCSLAVSPFLILWAPYLSHSFSIPPRLYFCIYPLLLFIPLNSLTLVRSPSMWGVGKVKGKGLMCRVIFLWAGGGCAGSFTSMVTFSLLTRLGAKWDYFHVFQMRGLRLKRVE